MKIFNRVYAYFGSDSTEVLREYLYHDEEESDLKKTIHNLQVVMELQEHPSTWRRLV